MNKRKARAIIESAKRNPQKLAVYVADPNASIADLRRIVRSRVVNNKPPILIDVLAHIRASEYFSVTPKDPKGLEVDALDCPDNIPLKKHVVYLKVFDRG